jgi:beta-galactosidase
MDGTDVWATFTNQFYKGKAAVISRKLGKGTVTYIGAGSDDGGLEKSMVSKVYKDAGIRTANYPKGVVADWRDGF